MLLVMPLVVNAQSVDTASAYLDLELPDSWYVFTRDNLDNNSDLEELELTKDYVMDYFLEYDLYVNAFDEDYDFYVYMNTTEDIGNLDDYYNFEVDDLAVELMNMYGANSYEIYDNDYKFIAISNSEWDKLKKEYIKNIKNGVQFVAIHCQTIQLNH